MTLPNFLVIGAMKSGTASLYEYLRGHPQVFMSDPKELDFFVEELNWGRGLDWYEKHFDGANGAHAVGEGSTNYAKFPLYERIPARIAGTLPEVRLIYLIRHPIARMRSQYLHQALHGEECEPAEKALLDNSVYVNLSRYALQIEQYLEHFPRESLLIAMSEDLRDDRETTMRRVFRFLGVDEMWSSRVLAEEFHRTAEKRVLRGAFAKIRAAPGYRALSRLAPEGLKTATLRLRTRGIDPRRAEISEGTRRRLEDLLRDDVRRLHEYLGRDFHGWGLV